MGSATREALAAATRELDAQKSVDLAAGQDLLRAAVVVAESASLRAALSDDAAPVAERRALVGRVFATASPAARAVLESLASGRWSNEQDLIAAVERLGVRAVAASAPAKTAIDQELFAFLSAVTAEPELELALGSRLGSTEGKVALVERLLSHASTQTVAIVSALVAQPRGRRIGELIREAAAIVAEAAGQRIATITVAAPLAAAQKERLVAALSARYGALRVNEVVDPTVLGGLRVQIGDDVIDGTIATRITDLRLQLAS